jgi:hypothetical protein
VIGGTEELGEGVLNDAAGEDLRGVVAGAALAVATREPVDEAAAAVADALLEAGKRLGAGDEHFLGVVAGPVDGEHPSALVRVGLAVLGFGHFVDVLVGEKSAVGHETLVDGAELVDPELGVGDEPAASAMRFPCFPSGVSMRSCRTRWTTSLRRVTPDSSGVAASSNRAASRPGN